MFGKILKKAANAAESKYDVVRNSYPVKRVLGENAYSGFNVVRTDEDGIPTSLNKKGKGILAATIGASAVYNAINERYTNDMGTQDGRITSLTPSYAAYTKTPSAAYQSAPAGADGSLVFALDRAKNGGYL